MSNITVNGTRATKGGSRKGLTLSKLNPGEAFRFKGSQSPSVYIKVTDERTLREDRYSDGVLFNDNNNTYVSVATGQVFNANPDARVVRVTGEMYT